MAITRDWQAGTLRVSIETVPANVDDATGEQIIRAATDFTLTELEFRDAVEIQTGSIAL